jgi:predicted metalloprotease
MEWTPGGTSSDIEDRRDDSDGGGGFGGGGFGGIHLGVIGTIVVALIGYFGHFDVSRFLGAPPDQPVPQSSSPGTASAETPEDRREEPEVKFVSVILDDVQNTWDTILPDQEHRPYRHAKLVLYRNSYPSGCGTAQRAIGPFYCPEDEKVYLDLSFFDELKSKFGAPGEFAQAYVIAHEFGHHVQKLLGIEPKVRRLQQEHPDEVNPLSVRLELQADCFAGVWGNQSRRRLKLEDSDVAAAMRAAAAVGDDRLQRMGQGYVNPETFTHGSSAQRVQWFRKGFDSGQVSACATFR